MNEEDMVFFDFSNSDDGSDQFVDACIYYTVYIQCNYLHIRTLHTKYLKCMYVSLFLQNLIT